MNRTIIQWSEIRTLTGIKKLCNRMNSSGKHEDSDELDWADDCWVWCRQGAKTSSPTVRVREKGIKYTLDLRRLVFSIQHPQILKHPKISVACKQAGCLNPKHLILKTTGEPI